MNAISSSSDNCDCEHNYVYNKNQIEILSVCNNDTSDAIKKAYSRIAFGGIEPILSCLSSTPTPTPSHFIKEESYRIFKIILTNPSFDDGDYTWIDWINRIDRIDWDGFSNNYNNYIWVDSPNKWAKYRYALLKVGGRIYQVCTSANVSDDIFWYWKMED